MGTAHSTTEQGQSGLGLEAQQDAIEGAVKTRGWTLVRLEQDTASGKSTNGRHGFKRALDSVKSGEADVLVVAKLDRLSRSLLDRLKLMERRERESWDFVVCDLDMDTSKPTGKLLLNLLGSIGEFEREMIGTRTKEALAVAKARGVRLGRPPELPEAVRKRVMKMRAGGMSLPQIASRLNAEAVPTAHGGAQWWPSTVAKIVA